MASQEVDNPCGIRTSVNHISQANDPVFRFELKPMQQGAERGKMTVDIAYDEDSVSLF